MLNLFMLLFVFDVYKNIDMKKNCAPACHTCTFLTVEGRCPIDVNAPNAWAAGSLELMFLKLTSEPYLSKYEVQILSSPATGDPWVITMENVVSESEAERLIELGHIESYQRSADVGNRKADGSYEKHVSTSRTSTNAW
jgi:prolyl 4-hydroxylase